MRNNKSGGEGIVWKRRSTKDEIMDQTQLIDSQTETEDKILMKKKKKQGGNNSNNNKMKKQGSKRYDLVSFQELPEYMKDNEFILNYYRTDWPLKQAFFSIFRWHNETLNVWT